MSCSIPFPLRWLAPAAPVLLAAGCASVDIDQALTEAGQPARDFKPGQIELARTGAQREAREKLASQLLAAPVSHDEAVQLALANSPDFQALLAEGWAQLAQARQAGRIANPVFSFERLRAPDGLEIGRLLSVGLLDVLTLPRRQAIASNQEAQARLRLSATIVEQVGLVRQAWVRAVAAQQLLAYAQQVYEAAQASADLARRMQQVGNFSALQRARQQMFEADASAQLATARHGAASAREELVRRLGLDDAQAARLVLPERLPELPAEPRPAADVQAAAIQQRLDWRLARLQLDAAGQAQGLSLLESLADVEIGARRDSVPGRAGGQSATRRGVELAVRLPLFDWGSAQRAAMDASALAAANRYEAVARSASSQLRQGYSAYRTAYEIARHHRDEIVLLRAAMSEENLRRYNGMLIGVFDLLAGTREQIAGVMAAIHAQQEFWLADASLSTALVGKPLEGLAQ